MTHDALSIGAAYDGSSLTFRALEATGWGDLVNLGYYPLWMLPALVSGLGPFQRELVRRSIGLLEVQHGHRVLDAACGRGYTTAQIARLGCTATGIDLVEDQIAEANRRFGNNCRVRFAVADATRIPEQLAGSATGAGSFDRVHCLEAAFHFGAAGRTAFLSECYRLLKPGGRLVLVDFVWRGMDPGEIKRYDPNRLVRGTWSFEEFEPLQRYLHQAVRIGFRTVDVIDWSNAVAKRFQTVCHSIVILSRTRIGRAALYRAFPNLPALGPSERAHLSAVIKAHGAVRRQSAYVALVLDKPAS